MGNFEYRFNTERLFFSNQSATNKSLKINSPGSLLHLVWRNHGVLHRNDGKLFYCAYTSGTGTFQIFLNPPGSIPRRAGGDGGGTLEITH